MLSFIYRLVNYDLGYFTWSDNDYQLIATYKHVGLHIMHIVDFRCKSKLVVNSLFL